MATRSASKVARLVAVLSRSPVSVLLDASCGRRLLLKHQCDKGPVELSMKKHTARAQRLGPVLASVVLACSGGAGDNDSPTSPAEVFPIDGQSSAAGGSHVSSTGEFDGRTANDPTSIEEASTDSSLANGDNIAPPDAPDEANAPGQRDGEEAKAATTNAGETPSAGGGAGLLGEETPPRDGSDDGVTMDPASPDDANGGSTEPSGPEDGDPSAPFSIPEVDCGGPGGRGFNSAGNLQLGGRDMILTYPCDKGAGAPMTFFLNLHGTSPVEQHFYIHNYFKIHEYSNSHNIIVISPSSVGEQWGNDDGGEDEPHLMEIIDWAYETFDGDDKFDIRGMWVGGHSWGAMYTSTFACKDEIADKVVGAFPMSGIGRQLSCADRISVLSSAAEDDVGPVIDQQDVPASNGCGAPVESQIAENIETFWPDCDPGFAYATYFMLGKTHSSAIDDVIVERVADLIKETRR
jgi:hypothetical protein